MDSFVGALDKISRVKQGWDSDSDVAALGDPALGAVSFLRRRIKEWSPNQDIPSMIEVVSEIARFGAADDEDEEFPDGEGCCDIEVARLYSTLLLLLISLSVLYCLCSSTSPDRWVLWPGFISTSTQSPDLVSIERSVGVVENGILSPSPSTLPLVISLLLHRLVSVLNTHRQGSPLKALLPATTTAR
jgi:hypothetical protein